MSTKPNVLRAAMQGVQHADMPAQPPAPAALPRKSRATTAPSRVGKRSVSAHFDPAVTRQLRILAAEQERTVQDLVGEALNDLFRKFNKSAIV